VVKSNRQQVRVCHLSVAPETLPSDVLGAGKIYLVGPASSSAERTISVVRRLASAGCVDEASCLGMLP
jgi:hypothetical protein